MVLKLKSQLRTRTTLFCGQGQADQAGTLAPSVRYRWRQWYQLEADPVTEGSTQHFSFLETDLVKKLNLKLLFADLSIYSTVLFKIIRGKVVNEEFSFKPFISYFSLFMLH